MGRAGGGARSGPAPTQTPELSRGGGRHLAGSPRGFLWEGSRGAAPKHPRGSEARGGGIETGYLRKVRFMTQNGVPDPSSRRPLGRTGLSVSPICVGCAPLGNMPETFEYSVSKQRAFDTLRSVFESPLNFLDTAASYGDGESERRIGEVLAEMGGLPEGYVLATKADRDPSAGDFSGKQMRRSVERSLRLLRLERLQLVHLHDP